MVHTLLKTRHTYTAFAAVAIILVLILIVKVGSSNAPPLVTTTAETGAVRQLVSVSGIAEAKQTAELAFPVSGIVREVFVDTGDAVAVGDTLATLEASSLYADRQDALAALDRVLADRDELLTGPTVSARAVTTETLAAKEAALRTTKETEAQKVQNAYRALLSTDLTAYADDPQEDAVPPTITGTYQCATEGSYTLDVFNSKANSGYSYRLSGIESGTYTATTEQPSELGDCGLRIQFDTDSIYSNSTWHIDIPNQRSASYVTNRNAYTLAITQAESAIALAEQAVAVAAAEAENQNAPARSEAIARADAAVTQAEARLSRINATISDRILRAPFSGVITRSDILPGETVTTAPAITLLASNAFEMIARIPEVDIGKLLPEQTVEMVFDARPQEVVTGSITFISPQATEIDGVAYYEAIIAFTDTPLWMRSGLNADIEIIIAEESTGVRVPKRFVQEADGTYTVIVRRGTITATTTVDVLLEGNDGFMAITGITSGDVLVAP